MNILLAWESQFIEYDGGMERVCCNMANEMVRKGHKVSILYCTEKIGKPFFPLCSDVELVNLADQWGGIEGGFKKAYMPLWAKCVREWLCAFDADAAREWREKWRDIFWRQPLSTLVKQIKPDVIVSFDLTTSARLQHCLEWDKHIPLITMFHFSVKEAIYHHSRRDQKAISESAYVQVLTHENAVKMRQWLSDERIVYIPNVVPQFEKTADLDIHKKEHTIIQVARLDKRQKRQHILIQAFHQMVEDFPEWNVELWGKEQSGSQYTEELTDLIKKYKLESRVHIKGTTSDVYSVYTSADILAFPSAYEGFGLAMTEGMSAGLPVVAFQSCSGVNEIVEDGRTGFLAEDGVASFMEKLRILMSDQPMRVKMGRAAHEAMKMYAPEKIWDRWEALLQQAINEK